jgi:two-component system phosphate regulon sensor histidine kinase PhoR
MDFRYLLNSQLTSLLHSLPENFSVLAMALESTNSGVVITDNRENDNPIIFCNRAFENLTGYNRDEIIGRNCRFLQSNDRAQESLAQISDSIASGLPITIELRNYHRNGTLFWNELSIAPVRNSEGVVTHFIGIQNDVTRKKAVQTELMEQIDMMSNRLAKQDVYLKNLEETLSGIMESARECLVILDKNLHVAKANHNFYDLFMLHPDDAVGKEFTSILPDPDTKLNNLFNEAFNQAGSNTESQLNVSFPQINCHEAKISINKISLNGIKDDYLLVRIRCSYKKEIVSLYS